MTKTQAEEKLSGLTTTEVEERLNKYGWNELPTTEKRKALNKQMHTKYIQCALEVI